MEELTDFEKKVLKYIDCYEGVSCVELSREFGKGTCEINMNDLNGNDINAIKAFGLSEELCNTIIKLISRGDIVETPCSYLVYLLDGVAVPLPVMEDVPSKPFEETHWLPTAYDSYEKGIQKVREMTNGNKIGERRIASIRQKHEKTYGKA